MICIAKKCTCSLCQNPHNSSITYKHRKGCSNWGYPLQLLRGHRLPGGVSQTQLPCVWNWDDRRWRSGTTQHQPSTGSCPVPPWLTRGHHHPRAGGFPSLVSCTHCSVKSSLLVSGWPLPRQGCCHWWAAWGHWWWLACRPSPLARLGGYLGKAVVTGCSAGHPESLPSYPTRCLAATKNTQTHGTRRCSPAVGVLLASPPPPSHLHWPWMGLATCLLWRKLLNLLEGGCAGSPELVCLAFGESSVTLAPFRKPRIGSTPWATGRFFPVHSVISADSRDNRRSRSA